VRKIKGLEAKKYLHHFWNLELYLSGPWSISDFEDCHSRQCTQKIEKASRDVLKINWNPIVIFPEEAQRFR